MKVKTAIITTDRDDLIKTEASSEQETIESTLEQVRDFMELTDCQEITIRIQRS